MAGAPPPAPREEGALDRPHLKPLTSLRFFAAMLVLVFHWAVPTRAEGPLWNIAHAGFVGVPLFFVLSGFILAYNYLDEAGRLRVPSRAFWAARFARIYPVYVLGLVVAAPHFLRNYVDFDSTASALGTIGLTGVLDLLLLQSWFPDVLQRWNGPGWSLSAEAFFYLAFPLLVPALARLRGPRLLGVAGGMWAVSLAAPTLFYLAGSATPERIEAFWPSVLVFNPLLRLPEFVIGVCIGRRYLERRRAPSPPRLSAVAALSVAAVLATMAFVPQPPPLFLYTTLLTPAFATLVYALAMMGSGPPVGRALSGSALVLLGRASYAMYILHLPILFAMQKVAADSRLDFRSIPFLLAYTAVVIAASLVTLRVVEEPMRVALRRRLAGSSRARPASTPDYSARTISE